MTEHADWDDDVLLAELGAAVRAADEVPAGFVATGKAAFAWRTFDAELAQLLADSAADPALAGGEPAGPGQGLRAGRTETRWLTFGAGELTIELEIRADALHGQLVPPGPGEVRIQVADGPTHTVPADEVGYFTLRPAPSGSVRLQVRTDTGRPLLTGWFVL